MQQYLDLVDGVLREGAHKPNRTGVDTVAAFSRRLEVDLAEGFPLLTTKRMSEFRWNSMIHELLWYLSGEHHIRTLREETGIWDAWADADWNLPSAYGRFWRRFPVPESGAHLPGEAWAGADCPWVARDPETGTLVFDQLGYVLDTLNGDNPDRDPRSRRLVVNAWHPANAGVSGLPPCHFTFVFNVQGDGSLNLHLTQRSGDVALGVPFNIAAYSLLLTAVARQTGFEPGVFAHDVVDAHVYCGRGARGEWYADRLDDLQSRLAAVEKRGEYRAVRDWVEQTAPEEPDGETGHDHVPGLLTQLAREPRERPELVLADKPLDELTAEDVSVRNYDPAPGLEFAVAE